MSAAKEMASAKNIENVSMAKSQLASKKMASSSDIEENISNEKKESIINQYRKR
jgi:hypothetical protein